MNMNEDIVEFVANKPDHVDTKHTPQTDYWNSFFDVYKRLRRYYGEDAGLTEFDSLPSIDDLTTLYKDVSLSDDAVLRRRWSVASELALLDIIIRDRVAIKKYLDSTPAQQYLTRAIDHYTKVASNDDRWDIEKWKFVITHKCVNDKYTLGRTAIFEDEIFHYRFCKDYEFANLFLEKFNEVDLSNVILAPLTKNAFSPST